MEESLSTGNIHSHKRKKNGPLSLNSDHLLGISTRCTSRIYFHQIPSAVSRSEPFPSKPIRNGESVEAILALNCSDASQVTSIKDLRTKRVFTPEVNLVRQEEREEEREEEENEEGRKLLKVSDPGWVNEVEIFGLLKSEVKDERNDIANCRNSKDQAISGKGSLSINKMALNRCSRRKVFKTSSSFNYRRLLPYLMDIANDTSSASKFEIVDGMNSELRSTAVNSYAAKTEGVVPQFDDLKPSENQDIQRVHTQKGYQNHMNGVDASMEEEHIQTTPPDPAIFTHTKFGHGGEFMEANKVLSGNHSFGSAKSSSDALKQSPNAKCNTNSMNRSVLNPCSRLKLCNSSRSLSYKRLLPFLMDISKDNSCATRNTQHTTPQAVLEVDDYVNKLKAEASACSMFPLPLSDGLCPDTNNILLSSMLDSSSPNFSSNLEPNVVTSETLPEEIPQTQSSPTKSEQGLELKDNISQSEPSSIVNSEILTKQCASEEPESVGKQKMCLGMGLEIQNCKAESLEKVNLKQNSLKVKASSNVFVCSGNRLPKGILKRNPLGCRGLCNCLSCASFRLHADRAFEFSQNQMHNAEEVASELMEELANLRFLLEKSITQNNDSVGIQLNPVLVEQACNRAVEAEKLAKGRLIKLNFDLSVHCRIPALVQPMVTFANNIEERAIPVLDPSTSTEKKE